MKWYKHDPNAALAGMMGLTVEERGAYYTLIDLLYARDGHVRDELVCKALACNPRTWRALKRQLIEKGKVWETPDGELMAKRVEWTLNEARMYTERQSKRARIRWQSEENQTVKNAIARNASTTTSTLRRREQPAIAGSSSALEGHSKQERIGRAPVVFECGVIRLTQKSLDDWRVAFPNLDLEGELHGLAPWAARTPNWFPAVSSALGKRNREMKVKLEQARYASAAKEPANDLQSVLNR